MFYFRVWSFTWPIPHGITQTNQTFWHANPPPSDCTIHQQHSNINKTQVININRPGINKQPTCNMNMQQSSLCRNSWSSSYKKPITSLNSGTFVPLCHCPLVGACLLSALRTKAKAEAVLCPQPAWLNLGRSLALSMVLKDRSIRLQPTRIGPQLIHYNNWLTMHWRWPCSEHQLQSCPIALSNWLGSTKHMETIIHLGSTGGFCTAVVRIRVI